MTFIWNDMCTHREQCLKKLLAKGIQSLPWKAQYQFWVTFLQHNTLDTRYGTSFWPKVDLTVWDKNLILICQSLNENRTHLWMEKGNSVSHPPKSTIAGPKASCCSKKIQSFPFVLYSAYKCCFCWLLQTQIHVSKFFSKTQHLEGFTAKWCSWLKKETRN